MNRDRRERITHLCFACFYVDNYSYQENLLPKFHARAGHDVTILASLATFDENGEPSEVETPGSYVNEHGIPVTRLPFRRLPLARRLRLYRGIYASLDRSRPTVLFVHGPQFLDALTVAWFLRRHPDVRAYVDNHADYTNSARTWASKWLLHKVFWRLCARVLERSVKAVYGVMPSRVDFVKDVYDLPPAKVKLLVMGADDDLVAATRAQTRASLREKYDLPLDSFIVATGGKIDAAKPQILSLLETVRNGEAEYDVAVFGSVTPAYRERYDELVDHPQVYSMGWLGERECLEVMRAADVVVFPGRHSVLWEQACALGQPLIVRALPGTDHVDHTDNCLFLERGDEAELRATIEKVMADPDQLMVLRNGAESAGREEFLYGRIAAAAIY